LGLEDLSDFIRKKSGKPTVRTTDVAALNPPQLRSLGPNGGNIKAVNDVTDRYDVDAFLGPGFGAVGILLPEDARKLPLFTAKTQKDGRTKTVLVPVAVSVTGLQLGSPDVTAVTGDENKAVVFRAFRIEEEVPRFRREQKEKAMEDLIHPGWYDDVWRPNKIGQAYQEFFGIGAITDPQSRGDGYLKIPTAEEEEAAQATEAAANAEGVEDPSVELLASLKLDEKSSIRDAVDFLVVTYSHIRQNNLNVDEFIRGYTWRPIATMADMFGTTDLKFSSDGEKVIGGVEGFHSRAFGPYDNLFGLASPEVKTILGIKRDSVAAQRADLRARKQEAVQQYTSALLFSRGILG
jgi:hypothetical protein